MRARWFEARRAPAPLPPSVEAMAAAAIERAMPAIEDLRVTALDDPAFVAGAEAMRREIVRVLRDEFKDCGCHPAYHELGVHAPVGNARSVAP